MVNFSEESGPQTGTLPVTVTTWEPQKRVY